MAALAAVFVLGAPTRGAPQRIDLARAVRDWRSLNRAPRLVDSGGRRFVRFDERPGVGLLWSDRVSLADGEIEFDVRGRSLFQKSFVGVAFRMRGDSAFDAVYLRPFNFQATDSTRHAHAVQYVSYPGHPWERLRADHPGEYEAPVVPAPNADDWVHVRLVLHGTHLQVFVNRAQHPALHVQTLGGRTRGGIGLWVGDLSNGDFANLAIRAE